MYPTTWNNDFSLSYCLSTTGYGIKISYCHTYQGQQVMWKESVAMVLKPLLALNDKQKLLFNVLDICRIHCQVSVTQGWKRVMV